jgi:tetratricopeptide (TPR) repeat protein
VLDRLLALVDHSLIQRASTPAEGAAAAAARRGRTEPRLTMLETVRAFALERLEARGESVAARARHARYFVALAEVAEPRLASGERAAWAALLEAEHDNLRAALAWTLDHEPAAGLRAAGALWWFWCFRGHLGEGRRWVEEALARARDAAPPSVRAKALTTAGFLAWAQGDFASAEARCASAVALSRASDHPAGLVAALVWQATVAWWQRELDLARARFAEAVDLARRVGDRWWLAFALRWRGDRMLASVDPAAWRRNLEESLGLFRETGDPWGVAIALEGLGQFHQAHGQFDRARVLLEEALALRRALGDAWFTAYSLRNLGELEHQAGRDERAEGLITESLAAFLQLGTRQAIAELHYWLGRIAQARGEGARAAARFREGFGLARAVGNEWAVALCLAGLAGVAAACGQAGPAARALAAAEPVLANIPPVMPIADRTAYDRDVAAARARLGEAAFDRAWEAGRSLGMEQARTALETALPE